MLAKLDYWWVDRGGGGWTALAGLCWWFGPEEVFKFAVSAGVVVFAGGCMLWLPVAFLTRGR